MTDKEYIQTATQYGDNVFRFLCKNMQDGEEAKDILQDTLEILWNNRRNIEKPKAKSYFFTVAYRNMLNVLKKNKVRSENAKLIGDLVATDNRTAETDHDNRQMISQAVNKLSEKARTCLLLKDWEGYKTGEISEIVGISEQNVKIILFRARKELKNIIEKELKR